MSTKRYNEYLALRETGLTYQEIANRCNVTRQAVHLSLTRKRTVRIKLMDVHHAVAMRLYYRGLADWDIARRLNVSRDLVFRWRKEYNLSSNRRVGRPRSIYMLGRPDKEGISTIPLSEIMKMYEKGMNDCAIAKEVGVTSNAIRNWRRRNNLPSKHTAGKPKKEVSK